MRCWSLLFVFHYKKIIRRGKERGRLGAFPQITFAEWSPASQSPGAAAGSPNPFCFPSRIAGSESILFSSNVCTLIRLLTAPIQQTGNYYFDLQSIQVNLRRGTANSAMAFFDLLTRTKPESFCFQICSGTAQAEQRGRRTQPACGYKVLWLGQQNEAVIHSVTGHNAFVAPTLLILGVPVLNADQIHAPASCSWINCSNCPVPGLGGKQG